MEDELTIFGGLDQPIPIDNKWILDRVDKIFNESLEKKNSSIIINACKALVQISRESGIALAKALCLLMEHWEAFNPSEPFRDVVYPQLGLHPLTIDRYIAVWKMLYEKAPKELQDDLRQRNIRDLVPIATAISQGYEIEDKTWKELVVAPDTNTILKIVREDVKGKEPRKGSIQISLDNLGSLWAFQDGRRYFVGTLEVDSEELTVQHAIERLIRNSGILRS